MDEKKLKALAVELTKDLKTEAELIEYLGHENSTPKSAKNCVHTGKT